MSLHIDFFNFASFEVYPIKKANVNKNDKKLQTCGLLNPVRNKNHMK